MSKFITGVFMFLSMMSVGQTHLITGRVLSEDERPVAFANVLILQDTTMVKGGITDDAGSFAFKIDAGAYILTVSYIGYEQHVDTLTIDSDMTLEDIVLTPLTTELSEIMVTEYRNEINAGIDKKVIHVSDELKRFSNNLSEILEMVPIVSMDLDGNPTIPGKSATIVLVNGREPRIRADNLATVLKLIPSDQIVKIEIMTNPPAKYTKSNAAVINVVTNKKPQSGQMVNLHASLDVLGALGAGGNFTMKRNKFALSSWVGRWAHRSMSESALERLNYDVEDLYRFTEKTESAYEGHGVYGGVSPEYQINEKNTVSMYVGGYTWNNHNDFNTQVATSDLNGMEVLGYQRADHAFYGGGGTFAGLEYFKTFDEEEKEFHLQGGLDIPFRNMLKEGMVLGSSPFYQEVKEYEIGWNVNLEIEYFEPIDSTSNLNIAFDVAKELPFDLTADNYSGMTPENVSRNEALSYFNTLEGLNQELSVTYAKKIDQWGLNLDLGQEYIQLDYLFDQQGRVKRDYFFVIPRASLTYSPEKKGEWGLSYRYGAEAPGRWSMNPNKVVSSDGLTEWFGNPNLSPERSHDVELNYGFYLGKFNLGATAFWRYSDNAISRFVRVTPEGVQQFTYENTGQFLRTGGSLTLSGTVRKKLKTSINASIFDSRIKTDVQADQSTLSYELGADLSYYLPMDFSISVAANYDGPERMIQGERDGYYRVKGSLKKSFLQGRINASIFFNDLFRSIEQTTHREGLGFRSLDETIRRPAYLGARVSVRIGELKDRPKSKRVGQQGG